MYDIVSQIIGHNWFGEAASEQEFIYCICGALILLFTVVFVDLIRDIIRSFVWRG